MVGVLQYLAVVVIAMWMFWRIFHKAGRNPWWSHVMVIAFVGLFTPLPIGLGLLFGVPVLMIWVFAFVPWPSIDNPRPLPDTPGYDPPEPERFTGSFQTNHTAERDDGPKEPRDYSPAGKETRR